MLKSKKCKNSLSSSLAIIIFLAACSNTEITQQKEEFHPVSFLTGKPGGTKMIDINKKEQSGDNMPINALLWRAALDIASFVPLDDVDTFGGSIVTEWYQSADKPNQRVKLTFFILGLELRSDAVKVHVYTQEKLDNNWVDTGQDEQLARKLEGLVLTRAREIRATSISETTKQYQRSKTLLVIIPVQ